MSQTTKTGAALDLFIMSKCADLLMKVPPDSRVAIVQWLATRVVGQQSKPTPPEPQTSMFEET